MAAGEHACGGGGGACSGTRRSKRRGTAVTDLTNNGGTIASKLAWHNVMQLTAQNTHNLAGTLTADWT